MENFSETNKLFQRTFSLVKYNMVLTIPFLLFWLILGFVLLPLNSGGAGQGIFFTLILLAGIIAAFLAGWMNMFKRCVETSVDENESEDKRTTDSFWLFREFFPGVGKYFGKMILGILIYFFLFNIMMLIVEMAIIPLFGSFESFSQQEMVKSLEDTDKTAQFWKSISSADKTRLFQIAGIEVLFTLLFFYLTMFWAQLVVLKELYPIKAIVESVKAAIKQPVETGTIFLLNFTLVLIVFFIGAILIANPLVKLIMILLFVYALVFYVMATFLYLEKEGETHTVIKTEQ